MEISGQDDDESVQTGYRCTPQLFTTYTVHQRAQDPPADPEQVGVV